MLFGATLLLAPLPAEAQQVMLAPGETLLEVQANGETLVAPDIALVTVGVVSTGTTARQATDANAQQMARVIAAIKDAGVADRYLRTQQINVSPRFARDAVHDYEGQARITGYVAQNSAAVTIRRLATAPDVIAAAFAAGANSVHGPNLQLDDDRAALTEARKAAIANARREADTYADSLGMRVARVLRVSERGQSAEPVSIVVTGSRMMHAPPPPPPPPPLMGGEMRQAVTVWVDFALAPR